MTGEKETFFLMIFFGGCSGVVMTLFLLNLFQRLCVLLTLAEKSVSLGHLDLLGMSLGTSS